MISLPQKIRQYMMVWRRRNLDQLSADLGKYVTATQAMRAYQRMCRRNKTTVRTADPSASGRRRVIRDTVGHLVQSGFLVKTGPCYWEVNTDAKS